MFFYLRLEKLRINHISLTWCRASAALCQWADSPSLNSAPTINVTMKKHWIEVTIRKTVENMAGRVQ